MGFMVSMPGTAAIRRALNNEFKGISQQAIRNKILPILKQEDDGQPGSKPVLVQVVEALDMERHFPNTKASNRRVFYEKFIGWLCAIHADWCMSPDDAPAYGQIKLFLSDRLENGPFRNIQFFWEPGTGRFGRRPVALTGPYGSDEFQVTAVTEPYSSIVARLMPQRAKGRAARVTKAKKAAKKAAKKKTSKKKAAKKKR